MHTCPRRFEAPPGRYQENADTWEEGHGLVGQDAIGTSCSYCGSLNPDRFLELVEQEWVVGPTDKPYKVYLSPPGRVGGREAKVYLQHLSEEQRDQFIDLYNTKQMKIGYPGRFYVLPFFCQPAPEGGDR